MTSMGSFFYKSSYKHLNEVSHYMGHLYRVSVAHMRCYSGEIRIYGKCWIMVGELKIGNHHHLPCMLNLPTCVFYLINACISKYIFSEMDLTFQWGEYLSRKIEKFKLKKLKV